jgi:hypothetical protein
MAPSEWRRRPARFQLGTPSGVHFNPPGGLRVPAHGKVTTMDLLTRMESLDDATLDAPVEISVDGIDCDPTVRSLLSRLVGQLAMWDAATHDRPYDFEAEQGESVAELRARLADAGPAFLSQVRTIVEEGRLGETFVDAVCDPPEVFTYGGMIAHVLTFGTHRRTLVLGALSDAGLKDLGAGDPMRWVAEPV